jgi:hypothetical protein
MWIDNTLGVIRFRPRNHQRFQDEMIDFPARIDSFRIKAQPEPWRWRSCNLVLQ